MHYIQLSAHSHIIHLYKKLHLYTYLFPPLFFLSLSTTNPFHIQHKSKKKIQKNHPKMQNLDPTIRILKREPDIIVLRNLVLTMVFALKSGHTLYAIVIVLHLLGLNVHRVKYIKIVCYRNIRKVQNKKSLNVF